MVHQSKIPERSQHRKVTFGMGSAVRTCAHSSKKPRTDRDDRQLRRFYEPLTLLYTLGPCRGQRRATALFGKAFDKHIDLGQLRRRFLSELAYVCDYDKGGDTVTAIGLESGPDGNTFWLAANTCPRKIIEPFLRSLLIILGDMATNDDSLGPNPAAIIARECIAFAKPKIKKYLNLLKRPISRCKIYLETHESSDDSDLCRWLDRWRPQSDLYEVCRCAYEDRNSKFMTRISFLGQEKEYRGSGEDVQAQFALARHYIGRLGHHFRAAKILLSYALRCSPILHNFRVDSIATPPRGVIPTPDNLTSLSSILVRMLPKDSSKLESYQEALHTMDTKHDIFQTFMENYTNANFKPRVHAEIQVLDHFYKNGLQFVDHDKFIACNSHQKIYLNWKSPETGPGREGDKKRIYDVLNKMTSRIREDAFQQIDQKSGRFAWHPDSTTGITKSVLSHADAYPLDGNISSPYLIESPDGDSMTSYVEDGQSSSLEGLAIAAMSSRQDTTVIAGRSEGWDRSSIASDGIVESEDESDGGVLLWE